MQKVNFSYEIIVSDDCSTDNTLNILRSYEHKHPEIIKVLSSRKNLGALENGKKAIDKGVGKYFSICDGDDYFLHRNKLQMCFDYMESNEGMSMVFTPALVIDEITKKEKIRNQYSKKEIDLIDLNWVLFKGGGFFPTSTSFYRSSIFLEAPSWLYRHSTGDYPFAILAILNGKIGYIDKVTSCYWKNPKSISNKFYGDKKIAVDEIYKKNILNLSFLDKLIEAKVIDDRLRKKLIAKEDYVLHSKFANEGLYFHALKGVTKIRYSLYFKLRILIKIFYSMFKRI